MLDNHFGGHGNVYNITIINIVKQPKEEIKAEPPKKEKKSLIERLKSLFDGGSSIVGFLKKFLPVILLLVPSI
jgi:hypothetical protein